MKRRAVILILMLVTLFSASTCLAVPWFVKPAENGGSDNETIHDGRSWDQAYATVQHAVQNAYYSEYGGEIWVAQGTYLDNNSYSYWPASVYLYDNIQLYGGFAGTETERSQRDPAAHETVLDSNGHRVVIEVEAGATVVIDGFTIQHGASASGGGGICCGFDSVPTIAHNVIRNNTSTGNGGGIYCGENSLAQITDNQLLNNAGTDGGGIHGDGGQAVLTNNLIRDNRATGNAGGICWLLSSEAPAPLRIDNNTLDNNTSSGPSGEGTGGGGLFCTAPVGYVVSLPPAVITRNTIRHNATTGTYGGGIYCGSLTVRIEGNHVDNNTSYHKGGGICVQGCIATIDNNTLDNNTAGGEGGGVAVMVFEVPGGYTASTVVSHNVFDNNSAGDHGGGLTFEWGQGHQVNNNLFVRNRITGGGSDHTGGGAIQVWVGDNVTIVNNTFVNNHTETGEAGGIRLSSFYDNKVLLRNNIFDNNTSTQCPQKGKSIYNAEPSNRCHVSFCNAFVRSPDDNNTQGAHYAGSGSNALVIDNASSMRYLDPGFVDYAGRDYHLSATSVCIDNGTGIIDSATTPATSMPDNWTDIDGQARIYGPRVDIGADEWEPTVTPTPTPTPTPAYSISGTVILKDFVSQPNLANFPVTIRLLNHDNQSLVRQDNVALHYIQGSSSIGFYAIDNFTLTGVLCGSYDVQFRDCPHWLTKT